jgi:hypothetical protein
VPERRARHAFALDMRRFVSLEAASQDVNPAARIRRPKLAQKAIPLPPDAAARAADRRGNVRTRRVREPDPAGPRWWRASLGHADFQRDP